MSCYQDSEGYGMFAAHVQPHTPHTHPIAIGQWLRVVGLNCTYWDEASEDSLGVCHREARVLLTRDSKVPPVAPPYLRQRPALTLLHCHLSHS